MGYTTVLRLRGDVGDESCVFQSQGVVPMPHRGHRGLEHECRVSSCQELGPTILTNMIYCARHEVVACSNENFPKTYGIQNTHLHFANTSKRHSMIS